jgi:hypothetical protein
MLDLRRFKKFFGRGRVTTFKKPEREHPHGGPPGQTTTPPPPTTFAPGGFPKTWMYWGTNGFGMPILTTQTLPGGVPSWDEALLDKLARWDFVTLNTQPFLTTGLPQNLAVVDKLRQRNANIRIYWYEQVTQRDINIAPGSPWTAIWDMVVAAPDKRLYFTSDGTGFPYHVASPLFWNDGLGGGGDAFASIWRTFTEGKGADGSFLDTLVPGGVGEADGLEANYAAQGYASKQALIDASVAGGIQLVEGIKAMGQPVWINRGMYDGAYPTANAMTCRGELFEGWDPNNGDNNVNVPAGPWSTFDAAVAVLCTRLGTDPTGDGSILVKAETLNSSPSADVLGKLQRYTLGAACIGGGWAYVGDNRNKHGFVDHNFWADEYAVDANGASDPSGAAANKGWLGRPTEFGVKAVAAAGPQGGGLWVRHFERGVCVANISPTSLSIDLGKPYRRILGTLQPSVNNGALVQNLTVPAKDARFLLNA